MYEVCPSGTDWHASRHRRRRYVGEIVWPDLGTPAATDAGMISLRSFVMMGGVLGVTAACGGDVDVFGPGSSGSGGSGAGNSSSSASGSCNCSGGAYLPVCGVDGQTYDATCGEHCVPVDIACEGECPCADCRTLEQEYLDAIQRAKACNPFIDGPPQCTQSVNHQLACPCPTFVSPSNSAVTEELQSLQAEWDALACGALTPCPEILCFEPVSAACAPNGTAGGGVCVDAEAQGGG